MATLDRLRTYYPERILKLLWDGASHHRSLKVRQQAAELIQRIEQFRQWINTNPGEVADRLWVKDHLDPEEEKLCISK